MTTTDQAALEEGNSTSLERVREELTRRTTPAVPVPAVDNARTLGDQLGIKTGVATPPKDTSAYQPPTFEERVQRHLERLRATADEHGAQLEAERLFAIEQDATYAGRLAAMTPEERNAA